MYVYKSHSPLLYNSPSPTIGLKRNIFFLICIVTISRKVELYSFLKESEKKTQSSPMSSPMLNFPFLNVAIV